jgi:hypothetical protein
MTDECSIDLTKAPFLRQMLGAVTVGRSPTPQQIERIKHRGRIILSLKREIRKSTDTCFIERCNSIIEQKKRDSGATRYE